MIIALFQGRLKSKINAKCEQGVIHQRRAFDINFFQCIFTVAVILFCRQRELVCALVEDYTRTIAHRTEG